MPFPGLGFWNPILFLVALVAVVVGWVRGWLTRPEAMVGIGLLLIPYVTRADEMSMGSHARFAAVVVPAYIVMARLLCRLPAPVVWIVYASLAVSLFSGPRSSRPTGRCVESLNAWSSAVDALSFLASSAKAKRHPIYALFGDEDFLKRLARARLIDIALGDEDPSFAVSVYSGEKLDFSTVRNELDTLPFLAPCRIVVVENADPFVTEHRPALEQYATKPSSVGVLDAGGEDVPRDDQARQGAARCAPSCRASRSRPTSSRPGASTGRRRATRRSSPPRRPRCWSNSSARAWECSIRSSRNSPARLGDNPAIAVEDVQRFVGRSKSADVFRILDAIGDGKPGEALTILEDLFAEGEDPMAILGPMTAQLRKLATVGRLHLNDGLPLGPAMDAAKVPGWDKARMAFERQLRHLGRRRLEKLIEWLTEINLGLKGGNPLPERVQVERLIVQLARPREMAGK